MIRKLCLAAAFAVFPAQLVNAQDRALSAILVELIQAEVRLAPPPAGTNFPSHEAHFLPGEDQVLTPYLFNQAIVSQLSTFPVGSPSGGFTYTFDPELGTYSRTSQTFGPSFAERALTIGRGRFNFGATYQHAGYKSFEGQDLENGDIRFYLTHQEGTGQFFEGDLVETALDLELTTNTFSLLANYGVTDHFDIGVAVPITNVSVSATVNATVLRLATADNPNIHVFPGGGSTASFSDSGSATGIGDILVRGKYRFFDAAAGGLAAAIDLRLPTGDEENLLGTGATQAKFSLIGSNAANRFAPHFNIGYTFSGESSNPFMNVTDEFNYVAGTELLASERVTINVDFIGRQLIDSGKLVNEARTFSFTPLGQQTQTATFNEFAFREGNLNLLTTAIGVKFNPVGNLLISANVLFPMTNSGIRSNPVPVFGFDYVF